MAKTIKLVWSKLRAYSLTMQSKCTDQVSDDIYKNLMPKHIAITSEVSIFR